MLKLVQIILKHSVYELNTPILPLSPLPTILPLSPTPSPLTPLSKVKQTESAWEAVLAGVAAARDASLQSPDLKALIRERGVPMHHRVSLVTHAR